MALLLAGCASSSRASTPTRTPTASPQVTPVSTHTPRPLASQTPVKNCLSQHGRLETGSLTADGLFRHRIDYRLYLPPCYDHTARQGYPILYLFHGLYYENDQWERIGALEIADRLIASGEAPPFLIAMPYDPTYREPSEYGFDEAVLDVLVPYIDQYYRTSTDPRYRAAGGLSRGGGWAIHFAFTRPDLFGAVGGHSPVVLYEDGESLPGLMREIPPGQMPRIYLDIGDKDSESDSLVWFEGLLTDMDIPHESYVYPGRHTEAYWSAHVEEYLRWYAVGWDE